MNGRYIGGAITLVLVGSCVATVLRPVDPTTFTSVELPDGRQCSEDVVALDLGACFYDERWRSPGEKSQSGLVRCGEMMTVCGRERACDCTRTQALFACEPDRTLRLLADGGVEPTFPMDEAQVPLPPLAPVRFKGTNEFGDCEFSLSPPRMGRCLVGGLIPSGGHEGVQTGLVVPFGEERQLCGVRLSCRCSEFTKRE
ncbi:hypothetical protein [Myxococcus virescens]|uniref:Lipoprotein n=1 Tax=Myxococcus virescens TaxID=83456 RepID=A0A511HLU3_9BACT|nr:hypothetical protein [Myxococcus virescens]GEL74552.1 hypothetical protein MVI01_63360 [Myxococcus virescens]SDD66647.1 hypothetical protein SAMN04488504_102193 [Myxococcus virescens]